MSTQNHDLPTKILAACAVLRNEAGEVLVLDTTVYRKNWDLPGGVVESSEPVAAAARREVWEEVGLDVTLRRLLAVDWSPPRPDRQADVQVFVFDGGVLTGDEIARITLQPQEARGFDFCDLAAAQQLLSPVIGRRLASALQALATSTTLYLENGSPAL